MWSEIMKTTKKTAVILLGVLVFVGAVLAKEFYAGTNKEQDMALLHSLKDDDLDKFTQLLKTGANPNIVFEREAWVMGLATQKEKIDFLKLAVEYGGDVNLNNTLNPYNRPIFHALLNHNQEAAKLLIEKGANLELGHCPKCAEDLRFTPVVMASNLNEYALVYYMIDKKGGLNPQETDQLIWEIESGLIDLESDANKWRMKVVEYLRAQGHAVEPKMRSRFQKQDD